MTYPFLSVFHLVSAISALVFGLCVFLTRKGTRLHKRTAVVGQVGKFMERPCLTIPVSKQYVARECLIIMRLSCIKRPLLNRNVAGPEQRFGNTQGVIGGGR